MLGNPFARTLFAALACVALIGAVVAYLRADGYQARVQEEAERTIENGEDFNEGAANPGGAGWLERLRRAAGAD